MFLGGMITRVRKQMTDDYLVFRNYKDTCTELNNKIICQSYPTSTAFMVFLQENKFYNFMMIFQLKLLLERLLTHNTKQLSQ
jgi:hypothetical protein